MNWSRDKNFWEEKAVNGEIYCMLSFGGGKFKQRIGIVTRTLGKRRLWMEKSIACWALKGKLKQWIGVETGTLRKRKLCIEKYYCMLGLGGGNLNNELESWQELFGRESCAWRNLLHVELWGGKFKQWIGIVARTLQQRKLWMGGGNLNNELESRQELFGRENCASRNSIACWAWGGNLNNELDSKQ